MAKSKRLLKSILKLLAPILIFLILAAAIAALWLDYKVARPQHLGYLVTPAKYGMLSSRGSQVTDETFQGKDGVSLRAWLLRGEPNQPAVILLHRFGADRSYVLNLGVKLNEATNFTVFMPEQRGHGPEPGETVCSFGGCEAEDVLSAVRFLKNLKTPEQFTLVGGGIGIYGLEMGALEALFAAEAEPEIKALALDSVPADSNALIAAAVERRFPFASVVTGRLAQLGTYAYFYDACFNRTSACESARNLQGRSVLLLAGSDAAKFQESTSRLSKCFQPSTRMDSKTDLSPSGMGILSASIETSEAYDQRIIDFFRSELGALR
ncbi:MAG: hypothetical protein C4324_03625 [Blastocatellia bacterium]